MDISWEKKSENFRILIINVDKSPWKEVMRTLFLPHLAFLKKSENFIDLEKRFLQIEKKIAWEQTLKLLALKGRFKEEVEKKLLLKKLSLEAIEDALARSEERNYLDEMQEGKRFVRKCLEKGYGPLLIRAKLQNQGASRQMCSELLEEAYLKQEEILKRTYEKIGAKCTRKDKLKVFAALSRRGFESEMIASLWE
jgi:SOS response regulatory protein OraA/RecX